MGILLVLVRHFFRGQMARRLKRKIENQNRKITTPFRAKKRISKHEKIHAV